MYCVSWWRDISRHILGVVVPGSGSSKNQAVEIVSVIAVYNRSVRPIM
jgi:hypothetical protein